MGFVVLLLGLRIQLCRIYLRCNICIAQRDVSYKDSRFGYVYRRFCFMDWYLPHRTAHSVDVAESYTNRNFLAVCDDVCSLHADCMEVDTGNCR